MSTKVDLGMVRDMAGDTRRCAAVVGRRADAVSELSSTELTDLDYHAP